MTHKPNHNRDNRGHRSERGFTLVEVAIVMVIMGLLTIPMFWLFRNQVQSVNTAETMAALDQGYDALLAYAAQNNGCLPFAADFEGGKVDTTSGGAASPGSVDPSTGIFTAGFADTGIGIPGQRAGDLPWADLGLTDGFVDGNGLRIQYYVASPYTDIDQNPSNGISCAAGFRGFEWNSAVTYIGTATNPVYVYYTDQGTRRLYEITGTLPAGITPAVAEAITLTELLCKHGDDDDDDDEKNHDDDDDDDDGKNHDDDNHDDDDDKDHKKKDHWTRIADGLWSTPGVGNCQSDTFSSHPPKVDDKKEISVVGVSVQLPFPLLEVRRGPDVLGPAPESDVVSAQNIFVLIAPGANRNAALDRLFIRDSNHVGDAFGTALALNASNVDSARFSRNHILNVTDQADAGDDTLTVMSFMSAKAALAEWGINLEPLCKDAC